MYSHVVKEMFFRLDVEAEEEEKEEEEEDDLTLFLLTTNMERKKDHLTRIYQQYITKPEQGKFNLSVQRMPEMDDKRHFSYFCMSNARFDELVHLISTCFRPAHKRTKISLSTKLAVTLQVLAHGSSLTAVAAVYKISRSTVRSIVFEVSRALWLTLKDQFLSFPSLAQLEGIAQEFGRMWNFPNCVGAIARKHIKLKAPSCTGSDSIVLMAACDTRYRFFMVDIYAYQKESDGVMFDRSSFGSALICGQLALPPPADLPGTTTKAPHVFIGDATFSLHANLMCPYEGMLQK